MSNLMALLEFARTVVKLRMAYGAMGEVGEVLLEPLLVVVREYVRYCVDVSAMAGKSLALPRLLRLLR